MDDTELNDDEVDGNIKKYFSTQEWDNLADILKTRYRNMYRNFVSVPGGEMYMPLPEFMRKSKQKEENEKKTNENKKSVPKKVVPTVEPNARRNPVRSIPKVNYYEPDVPKEDRYVFCDNCQEESLDFCSTCGLLIWLKDYPVSMNTGDRAKKTIPKGVLEIRQSRIHGYGVFTVRDLRKGIRMGPYQGNISRVENTNGYSWKLRDGRLIDGGDESTSNWMRYVNCARNVLEQNVVAFQYNGGLYYRTCRDIKKNEELLVYYGESFAKNLGIDTKKYFQPVQEEINLDYYTCEHCHIGLSTKEYRDAHQLRCRFMPRKVYTKDDGFDCRYCQCPITTLEFLEKHEKYCRRRVMVKNKKNEKDCKEFQCPSCEYKSIHENALKRHVNHIHEIDNLVLFSCEHCNYKTHYKSDLKTHQFIHSRNEKYKCPKCQKGFYTKYNFDDHLLRKHDNLYSLVTSKIHSCNFCDYKTTKKTDLVKHVDSKHSRLKKYQCGYCLHACVQKTDLGRHISSVHLKLKPFICTGCNKTFNQKRHLDSHIVVHHQKNLDLMKMLTSKIYSCDNCSYKCINKAHLTNHIKTHKTQVI